MISEVLSNITIIHNYYLYEYAMCQIFAEYNCLNYTKAIELLFISFYFLEEF